LREAGAQQINPVIGICIERRVECCGAQLGLNIVNGIGEYP
jgi:hypothetical protein